MPQSNGQDPNSPAISVVVPVRNEAGNIAPLVAEIAAALQGRAFEIVYVDDGSQEAGAPRLGLIAGQRVGRKSTGFKRLQSRIANGVRSAVLKDGTRDTGCGLKAFRRDVFLGLPYFDGLHRFLPALVRRDGFGVGYVDVVDRPRRHGTSNYGFFDRLWIGILDLAGVWWLVRRKRRVPQAEEVTLAG